MSPVRPKDHGFSRYLHALLIILVLTISLGTPVTGLLNNSTENVNGFPVIQNATVYESQGKALMAEKNWSGVINSTNEGLRYYPYEPELLCLQGYALRKTGHYQEAVDLISQAIPNDTRPVRYANRGYGYLAMGKTQDAIHDADAAIALDPSYATAYALKASALRMSGDISAAGETIEKALGLEPDNAYYLHVKGGILADKGDCNGAIEAYRHSIAINANYDLPWPGLSNASVDLDKENTRCAAPGLQTSPTRAASPVIIVIIAGIIVTGLVSRRQ